MCRGIPLTQTLWKGTENLFDLNECPMQFLQNLAVEIFFWTKTEKRVVRLNDNFQAF